MPPPPTSLPDPRHEAFAVHLARGMPPATAYRNAGFSDSSLLERSQALAENPAIAARVEHLRTTLPHTDAMRARYAPSLLLIPESKDQMLAWLWQVMNGTRKILPLQLRAATLFTRLKGWHLQKSGPHAGTTAEGNPCAAAQRGPLSPLSGQDQSTHHAPRDAPRKSVAPMQNPPPSEPTLPDLTELEQCLLARQNNATIRTDNELRPPDTDAVTCCYSKMADYAFLAAFQFPATRQIPFITRFLMQQDPEPEQEPAAEAAAGEAGSVEAAAAESAAESKSESEPAIPGASKTEATPATATSIPSTPAPPLSSPLPPSPIPNPHDSVPMILTKSLPRSTPVPPQSSSVGPQLSLNSPPQTLRAANTAQQPPNRPRRRHPIPARLG